MRHGQDLLCRSLSRALFGLALTACGAAGSQPQLGPAGTAPGAAHGAAPSANTDLADRDLAALAELAAHGPTAKDYPQADALVALARDDVSLNPDGSVIEHHKSIVKLLDAQRGKEKFADVHIPLDRKRQELEILVARTVNADGVPHPVSPEEIGDIVPENLAEATVYSDVRERVISFPAVDTGSVVELEFTRTTHATPDAPLGGEKLLAEWDPVLERTVTIRAPAGVTPKLEVSGGSLPSGPVPSSPLPSSAVPGTALEPSVSDTAEGRVWIYTLRALPDRHPEQDSPPDAAVLPRLVYSFQDDWSRVQASVGERFARVALPSPLPASISTQAAALVRGAATATERAARLFAFVAHEIRSIQLPLGAAGYEPHAPDVVLANRYGDCRDKASLLLALAAAQGITGHPVLVRTGKVAVLPAVPTLAQFDQLLVVLNVDGHDVWLDPSDEDGQYGLAFAGQDNLALPLAPHTELSLRPAQHPSDSVSHVSAELALAPNGDLDASYRYELSGYYANRASNELRPLEGEPLAQFFQRAAVTVSAAALGRGHKVGDTRSVTGPIAISEHIAAPSYAPAQAQFRVVELPPVPLGLADDVPSASLSARNDPLYVGVPRTRTRDLTLQIPAGWRVSYVPAKLEGKSAGIGFSSECRTSAQTVTCHDQIELDHVIIPATDYAAFRAALTQLQAYERRVVLLTRS